MRLMMKLSSFEELSKRARNKAVQSALIPVYDGVREVVAIAKSESLFTARIFPFRAPSFDLKWRILSSLLRILIFAVNRRKDDIKRQRTNSGSSSSPLNSKNSPSNTDSDEDVGINHKPGEGISKKGKGNGSRNTRDKEALEREKEREKQRADAAGRRKGRAERRRADGTTPPTPQPQPPCYSSTNLTSLDSDPSDETLLPHPTSTKDPNLDPTTDLPPSSQPIPDTPPIPHEPTPIKVSHRKTGRPPTKRGRVGRNQYTKDRDIRLELNGADLDPSGIASPLRSRSRDPHNNNNGSNGVDSPHNGTAVAGHYTNGEGGPRHSKVKHLNPHRTSLNEMKRRVAAILEFISRTQVEMAGAELTAGSSPMVKGVGPDVEPGSSQLAFVKGLMAGLGELAGGGGGGEGGANGMSNGNGGEEGKAFAQLTSAEMMDFLTRRLVRWQQEYGKWGER